MPDFITADYLNGRAKELALEAKAIYTNPNASADDLEKAERIMTVEIPDYQKRAHSLMELDKIVNNDVVEIEKRKSDAEINKRKQDEQSLEIKSMAEFLKLVDEANYRGKKDSRLVYFESETKDLAESAGSTGGFLVPVEQATQMYMASAPGAIVRPRATVIPMARRELTIPVLDQTGTTAGEFHWFGGLQVYWQAEASEKSQSEPSFRQIRLVANDLVGYTRASEALLEDNAASLESFLTGPMGFGGAMVAAEDYAFFNGTGVGQPLGILNATGVTTSVARAVQASVTYEDLLDMEAAFYSPNNSGMWVISQSQMANIMKMTGPTGNPNYVYRPSAADGSPATLLGRPVRFTLDMLPRGTTTSAGDVLLADFGFYLVGDRKRITVDSTRQERWRFNQVSWKVVARVDGQPWLSAPITSRDGVTTVSPFVLLGAKAT
jgi:HK97 family phage major capsid protein